MSPDTHDYPRCGHASRTFTFHKVQFTLSLKAQAHGTVAFIRIGNCSQVPAVQAVYVMPQLVQQISNLAQALAVCNKRHARLRCCLYPSKHCQSLGVTHEPALPGGDHSHRPPGGAQLLIPLLACPLSIDIPPSTLWPLWALKSGWPSSRPEDPSNGREHYQRWCHSCCPVGT